jgi:membrane-bound lytic murein transglycosylase D
LNLFQQSRVRTGAVISSAAILLLGGCATTTQPQQFRTFFVPPARPKVPAERPVVEAPSTGAERFSGELPFPTSASSSSLPTLPRPTDADFLIRKADNFFNAGKKAFQGGDVAGARVEFNRAVETLMAPPPAGSTLISSAEDSQERARVDRRLDELIEAIYRYDADSQAMPSTTGKLVAQESFDKSPIDEILELTFPVDPSLRSKINEQIQATASQLPLEQNDAVLSYINFFSSERGKKILAFGLKQSGRYRAMISRVLAQEGVPQELIFLAQAESAFQPRAVSRALCVGIWQFERHTGAEYGLVPGIATDDRMDPEKATRAAAHHLHDLYTHFGDWYLAMAAYNCGPACIDHAVARTGYADFWELRRLNVLPRETANYVPAILAMTIVAKNAKEYGLEEVELEPALEYDTMELEAPTNLALVAAALDRPISELKDLNPAVLHFVAPAGYPLHIPKDTRSLVEEAFQVIPASHRDSWRIHRIEAGDTFATIAKKYSTTALMVASTNGEELPEVGRLAAVPSPYPGDRPVVQRAAVQRGIAPKPVAAHASASAAKVVPVPLRKPQAQVHAPIARTPAAVSKRPIAANKPVLRAAAHRPGA